MADRLTGFTWGIDGTPGELEIEAGRVRYVGAPRPDLDTPSTDLAGKLVFPGLIDNHCHILPSGRALMHLNLGCAHSREAVLDAVRERHAQLDPASWLMAVQYDQTRFPDGRHITRQELDAISTDRPILLRQVSGHASVANSAALRAGGVDRSTPNPEGGEYVRDASGELTGLLLETAHEKVTASTPELTTEEMVDAILRAAESMASYGIRCATDMQTGRYNLEKELEAYKLAAERGSPVRFRLFVEWAYAFGPKAMPRERFLEWERALDQDRVKIAGIKLFADGAIGSATAAIYGRYASSDGSGAADEGQLIYAPDRLNEMVKIAHDAGYVVAIHAIGDRASDLVMDAFEATGEPSRHRIEHAMMLSDAQIDRLARLGCHVTMQPEFLARFGHAYRRQLGDERARSLKRFRSVVDAGLTLSLSSDRPIVAGDAAVGLKAATNRPEGFDPAENLTRAEAFAGMTYLAAAGNGDADHMGSLRAGELADVWITDESPI